MQLHARVAHVGLQVRMNYFLCSFTNHVVPCQVLINEIIYLFFYIILPYFPYFLVLKQYYNIAIFLPVCVVAPMNVPGTAPAARTTAFAVATKNILGSIAPVKFAPNDVPATAHGTCNLVFLDHCFCLFCLHVNMLST
jgi:hypothetical protein